MPVYAQLLLALAPYLAPIIIAVATVLVKNAIEKMPSNVQPLVSSVVRTAVTGVEQMASSELNGPGKKQLAIELVEKQLAHYHIAVPSVVVSTLIEEAVMGLNMVKSGQSTAVTPVPMTAVAVEAK